MLMTPFLTLKTLSTGKVELLICWIQARRGEIFLCTGAAATGQRRTVCGCTFAVCACVCVRVHEVKVLHQAKAMFYNTNARWTTLEEEEAAARCPTEHTCTHRHTQPSPWEGGRGRGGHINTQLIDRTNSICKCLSSCWPSGAFCWGSQKLNKRWQIWLQRVFKIWDLCSSKELKVKCKVMQAH